MEDTVRWGIIGPGKIAGKFAKDIGVLPQARLYAVASRSLDKAQAFAGLHGIPHAFGSYEELLECPGLDAVYVATPHTGHHPHVLLCLEKGIPVLCEKPFAVNAAQARDMVATARSRQTFLMEALWTRFLPTIQKALEIVHSGTLGRVLSIRADFGFLPVFDPHSRLFDPALAGGALLDVGVYPVFLAHLFLGKPERISALGTLGSTGVDEETAIAMQWRDGAMAQLHCSVRASTKTEAFIHCEKGTIYLHTRWYSTTTMSVLQTGETPQFFSFDYPCGGFSYQIAEVMRCLRLGWHESPQIPLDFSVDVMETLDEVRRQIGLRYPMEQGPA